MIAGCVCTWAHLRARVHACVRVYACVFVCACVSRMFVYVCHVCACVFERARVCVRNLFCVYLHACARAGGRRSARSCVSASRLLSPSREASRSRAVATEPVPGGIPCMPAPGPARQGSRSGPEAEPAIISRREREERFMIWLTEGGGQKWQTGGRWGDWEGGVLFPR